MGNRILIGVTGSIAAYKALEIVRMLSKASYETDVILTTSGERFIPRLNFESFTSGDVVSDFWTENHRQPIHIKLSRSAKVLAVVPGTADFIAKAAAGIADDLLTAVFLAFQGPKLIAPAMNPNMYDNPITQRNIRTLKEYGVIFIEPVQGYLADYTRGSGHLADTVEIFDYIERYIRPPLLEKKKVVITAGGTREPLDPVRFLGNPSTGLTGIELAKELWKLGSDVTVLGANLLVPVPSYLKVISSDSHSKMELNAKKQFKGCDIYISTAAISDFSPVSPSKHKIKKSGMPSRLNLTKNSDILKELSKIKGKRILIGFAAETVNLEKETIRKLKEKRLDIIIGNLIGSKSGFGFVSATGIILGRDIRVEFSGLDKKQLSRKIVEVLLQVLYGNSFSLDNFCKI
ncbi:MAG TPA: bifunctional phosphopantothenoylcysteine decarboxylase/phosphopantothenate--cysteine ligase CoaBC [Firmicutes bacterium]|nr:bifunctional phosphopantothenoylcysteine decarboxylase/phosphopantothenate--cysteine ligase CoaBC [Bacillota bacterium]